MTEPWDPSLRRRRCNNLRAALPLLATTLISACFANAAAAAPSDGSVKGVRRGDPEQMLLLLSELDGNGTVSIGNTTASVEPKGPLPWDDDDHHLRGAGEKEMLEVEVAAFGRKFLLFLEEEEEEEDLRSGQLRSSKLIPTKANRSLLFLLTGEAEEKNFPHQTGRGSAVLVYDKGRRTFSGKFDVGGADLFVIEDQDDDAKTGQMKIKRMDRRQRFNNGTAASRRISTFQHDSAVAVSEVGGPGEATTARLSRAKRGSVCEMLVMVDHSLYKAMKRDEDRASKLAMRLVASASKVYQSQIKVTVGQSSMGVKLRLKDLVVASDEICSENKFSNSYLCLPEAFAGYSDRFLRMHSRTDFSDYCLSYLLTHLDFDATLGVAYVGGVCANHGLVRDENTKKVERRSTNAGFITVEHPLNPLEEDMAAHTMAHEIGHNFGSSHDNPAKNPGCSGYLMEPIAPAYVTRKRLTFSSCSLSAVRDVLAKMRRGEKDWCFVKDKKKKVYIPPPSKGGGGTKGVFGGGSGGEGGGVKTRFWGGGGGNREGGGGNVQVDVVGERGDSSKVPLGLVAGLTSSLTLILIFGGLFVAYAFVEQRFCFGPRKIRGEADWLRKDVSDTLRKEKRRLSKIVRHSAASTASPAAESRRPPPSKPLPPVPMSKPRKVELPPQRVEPKFTPLRQISPAFVQDSSIMSGTRPAVPLSTLKPGHPLAPPGRKPPIPPGRKPPVLPAQIKPATFNFAPARPTHQSQMSERQKPRSNIHGALENVFMRGPPKNH